MLMLLLLWGLILGPGPPPPAPDETPAPGPGGIWLPPLPPFPLPLPVPPKPPVPPPPPLRQRVECLQWEFPDAAGSDVAKFLIQITGRTAGEALGLANVPKQIREVPIERLLLWQDGRYEVTMFPVNMQNTKGDPSNSVCLEVLNRQVYSCGEDVPSGCQGKS